MQHHHSKEVDRFFLWERHLVTAVAFSEGWLPRFHLLFAAGLASTLRHNTGTPIDIHGLAGEAPPVGRRQEGTGETYIHDVHQFADR